MSFASSRARMYVMNAAMTIATMSPAESQTTSSRRIERARLTCLPESSCARPIGFRDHPPDTAHVANDIGPELAAHSMYVHLHRVALDLLVPAVELFLELRPRQDCARTFEERLQQRELAPRQRDGSTAKS